eukprot:CAMPEP_0198282526 /NCGR_PEP_ID=MMETSP1449-20131203/2315_1 /TAXON_ID=420275 /ORGANISM="Attheya septentrionalis, Strain CCMP2084" /LENGTH=847 /DNA_ID=CAMNT_0043978801 /DNA_START=210 /DNA_END=2753 /DNA_ORIENTATION=-
MEGSKLSLEGRSLDETFSQNEEQINASLSVESKLVHTEESMVHFSYRRRRKRRVTKPGTRTITSISDSSNQEEQAKSMMESANESSSFSADCEGGKRRRRVYGKNADPSILQEKLETINSKESDEAIGTRIIRNSLSSDELDFESEDNSGQRSSYLPATAAIPIGLTKDHKTVRRQTTTVKRRASLMTNNRLPCLLYCREMGYMGTSRTNVHSRGSTMAWQSLALRQHSPSISPSYDGTKKSKNTSPKSKNVRQSLLEIQRRGLLRWKHCFLRSIPFSSLETLWTDAVLGLDRTGSYMLSIGGGQEQTENVHNQSRREGSTFSKRRYPSLVIRMYVVPSPASLHQRKSTINISGRPSNSCSVSHLLQTVPLLLKTNDLEETRNREAPPIVLETNQVSSPGTTPVYILTTSDSVMGVAFLQHSSSGSNGVEESSSPALQDEDVLGTVILFPLGSTASYCSSSNVRQIQKTFQLSNVRIGGWRSFTMRNLLWKTGTVPFKQKSGVSDNHTIHETEVRGSSYCNGFVNNDAYVLFNDEDDGYRVTWVARLGEVEKDNWISFVSNTQSPRFKIQPMRNDIISESDGVSWDPIHSDSRYGFISCDDADRHEEDLHIAFEAYIHIDALLSDILTRRKSFGFCTRDDAIFIPDFFYNMVSMSDNGRTIGLILVFGDSNSAVNYMGRRRESKADAVGANKIPSKQPAAFGIYLRLDIFDQSYEEIEWVQHPSKSSSAFLRDWSNSLALHFRMKDKSIGPFSVKGDKHSFHKWSIPTHELNTGEDEPNDFNPDVWCPYVETVDGQRRKKNGVSIPKKIAMSSLYPDCDVYTNRNVTSGKPVQKLECRDAPVSLSYG